MFLVALARRNFQQDNRDQTRINGQIRITPIRVVSEDGEQLGVLATEDALERARDAGLDLVEVAPNERPPVCRIMDYGKFKYEKKKKTNKGQTHTKTKEIRLRPKPAKKISEPRSAKLRNSWLTKTRFRSVFCFAVAKWLTSKKAVKSWKWSSKS